MKFGSVLDRNLTQKIAINKSTTTRFHKMATVKAFPPDAEVILSIFSGINRGYPFEIKMMESEEPWLVVVAPDAGDKPDEKRIQCFRVAGNQGVQYNCNVWHHPLLILAKKQDFFIVDRDTNCNNLHEYFFDKPAALIDVDPHYLPN
jgi:ureidoglycolate lyase